MKLAPGCKACSAETADRLVVQNHQQEPMTLGEMFVYGVVIAQRGDSMDFCPLHRFAYESIKELMAKLAPAEKS
jgi:hypothetical protein